MPERRVSVPIASIAEMVTSDEYAHYLDGLRVRPAPDRAGEKPIRKPEMIAAISMPDPV